MGEDLRRLARGLVKQHLCEKEARRETKGLWVLARSEDTHCIVFHLFVLAGYGTAFWVYLHPEQARIHSRAEMAAFVSVSALLLGWVSGINLGLNYHNHVHRRLFSVPWLNRWFGRIWALTNGWPACFGLHSHVTVHHADTLGPTDWTLPKRLDDGSFEHKWKYNALHWPWRYAAHLWADWRSRTYPLLTSEAPGDLLAFCVLYSIPFLIDPMMGLLLWFAPHYVGNVFILGSGMWVQHVGCQAEDEAHPFRTSNTYLSRFSNLVTFNSGLHNLHHAFPHIHWADLPEFQRLLQQAFDADGASALRVGMFRTSAEVTREQDWPVFVAKFSQ